MKTHHGTSIKLVGPAMIWVVGGVFGLLSIWLLGTTSMAASGADQVSERSPTPSSHSIWLPMISKKYLSCGDQYEPNNSFSAAPLIGAGSSIDVTLRANFCGGDRDDVYKIDAQVATTSTLVVDLTDVPADTDLDLYLYDAQLTLVGSSSAGGNGADERIEYHQMRTGRYFIRVYPYRTPQNGDTRWYNLQVRLN